MNSYSCCVDCNALVDVSERGIVERCDHCAEIERLQKVVADARVESMSVMYAQTALVRQIGENDSLVKKLREEAQTSRLALDVALKEVERLKTLRDQATLLHEAALDAQRAGGKTVVYKPHTRPTEFVFQDEPPPGAAITFPPTSSDFGQVVAVSLHESITGDDEPEPGAATDERNMASDEGVQQRKAMSESQWRGDE